jgi:hypothetical protein
MTSVADVGEGDRQPTGQGGDVDVSVIIAAYNAAEFIHFAVESALSQAAPSLSLEVLVIDDASSDATAERVAALATDDEAVRLISLPANGGPSVARNAGLDVARGTWVAVLDADDRFEPGHLARLVALAERTSADLVLANLLLYDPKLGRGAQAPLKLRDPQPHWTTADFVERARPLTGQIDWGLLKPLFRREFLRANGVRYTPRSRHGEDFLLMVDALRKGGKLRISPEPRSCWQTLPSSPTRLWRKRSAPASRRCAAGKRAAPSRSAWTGANTASCGMRCARRAGCGPISGAWRSRRRRGRSGGGRDGSCRRPHPGL